jgi:CheY-specific phosphatase CheX
LNRESWQIVHEELSRCCGELFERCGVATRSEGLLPDDAQPAAGLVAFIGFSGEKLTGSLALVLPETLIEQTHPMRGQIAGDPRAAMHDWAGELSNQLLGSLKNRLLRYGVVLQLSTPITLQGRELRGRSEAREGFACLRFRASDAAFDLHFDASAAEGVEISARTPDEATDDVANGDVLLF